MIYGAAGICLAALIGAIILFFYLNIGTPKNALAVAIGDYRSAATGNWSSTSSWETYNGASWIAAIATPTSASGVITIQSGHTITVNASVAVDQVVIDAGGILTMTSGTLTVANGAGSDVDVSGTVNKNAGTVTINSGARITILTGGTYSFNGGNQSSTGWVVNNGGTYVHNVDGIVIPTATWGATSTLKITGVTSSDVTGTYQDFGNVIYNCPSQTCCPGGGSGSTLEFIDNLKTIAGDFTVLNTGSGGTWLQKNSTVTPVIISGNYFQSGGTVFMAKGATFSWNLMGNFTLTGGTFVQAERYSMPTLNCYGTFLITGGTFNHSTYNSNLPNEGVGTVNLYGNYSRTGGLHTETATQTGHGEFNFTKSGTQTFTHSGGSITNTVNFTVTSGSITDLADYTITGGGTFTLQSGGGLILGSANGITSSGASGNVQVTGTRSYSTGGDYTYAGTSAQVTGNGLPTTAHNLTFNNSNNVTMTNSSSATNIVTLTSGKVITNSNELGTTNTSTSSVVNYSSARYVVGNLRRSVATTGSYDFPVGVMDYYELANVNLSGMTGFTDILGLFTNENPQEPAYPLWPFTGIYVNQTPIIDMLNYGYWTLSPNSAMTGGTYSVTISEQGHTNPESSPYMYCVLKRDGKGYPWQSVGTHTNSTQSEVNGVATAARSALSSFSHFGIGKNGQMQLPIELVSFEAEQSGHSVLCTWMTAAEMANDYFEIERSTDGITFEPVKEIDGAGTSNSALSYVATDDNPPVGKTFYRLKQVNFNGGYSYSEIRMVNIQESLHGEVSVYPNPSTGIFNISIIGFSENTMIRVFDITGALVKEMPAAPRQELNLTREHPGIYLLKVGIGNKDDVKKQLIVNR